MSTLSSLIARTAIIHDVAELPVDLQIGDFSIVGHPGSQAGNVRVGRAVKIGCYTIIGTDVELCECVEIDHFCKIGEGTRVGPNTRILYGARIYDDVVIGANCIVGGELADNTVIESDVTFMGRIAHSYRAPVGPKRWDDPDCTQASPTVRTRSVVGEGAMLIGGISVGPRSYVAAGELVRCDVPQDSVFIKGEISPLAQWKGFIKVREPGGM
jgi:acetyltransferase-like isoleucine patch superfamily enzyme